MPWSFIVPAAISLFTSNEQSNAAQEAASTAGASADRAAQLQRETAREQLALQQRMYEEGVARQQPYYQAGTNALARMQQQYNKMPAAFTGRVDLNQDPGYAFRLREGQRALDRQAAARGGLISGGALKAATRYGQEMGSQEYGNAYNRALTKYNADVNRESTGYNRLAAMSGTGQTAANTIGAAGQNYATGAGNIAGTMAGNVGNLYMQQGVNQGNALLAGSQARTSSYGDIAKLYGQTNPNFGGLFGGGGSMQNIYDPTYQFGNNPLG
jgi:hypothetical protein